MPTVALLAYTITPCYTAVVELSTAWKWRRYYTFTAFSTSLPDRQRGDVEANPPPSSEKESVESRPFEESLREFYVARVVTVSMSVFERSMLGTQCISVH